jgi:hypothetical protein
VAGNDRAIVVGVARYPSLGDLGGPEADAIDFCTWLSASDGGGLPLPPATNVKRILSSDYQATADPLDAEPTLSRLENAFDQLHDRGQANEGKAGRRLYIYLAGHGFAPDLENAAVLMANAARGRTGYHLAGRPYANWFRQAAYFDEVVLFMDCCRENYPRAPLRLPPYEAISARTPAGYFYGFATEWSRAAREIPWGPERQLRGLFTVALLTGLRGGAGRDASGNITAQTLESLVYNYVSAAGGANGELQEPKFDYSKPAPLVFSNVVPTLSRVRIILEGTNQGQPVEMLNGSLQPVGRAPAAHTAIVWEWDLPAGLYKARVPAGAGATFEVVGKPEVLDVHI